MDGVGARGALAAGGSGGVTWFFVFVLVLNVASNILLLAGVYACESRISALEERQR